MTMPLSACRGLADSMSSMPRLLAVLALLCALPAGAAFAAPPSAAEASGDLEPAAPEGLPRSAQAAYDAAWRAMTAGDLQAALEHLDKAIALHPLPVLVYNHGRVLQRMGDSRGAYEAFLKVQAAPEASPSLKKLAERRSRSLAPVLPTAARPGPGPGLDKNGSPVTALEELEDPGPWPAVLATAGTVVGFAGAWMLWDADERRDLARNSGSQGEVRTNDLTQAEAYRLRDEANLLAPIGAGTALVGAAAVLTGIVWWAWSGGDRLEPAAWNDGGPTMGIRLKL